jgi:L-lactate dehydrogenase complex protein LldG
MARDNSSREQILERVRNAVKVKAPMRTPVERGPIFAPVANVLERFRSEAAANLVELVLTPDAAASAAAIQQVLASLPAGEIFIEDAPELRSLASQLANGRPFRWSSEGGPNEASQATITRCEALVALTGSIAVSSGCGGRGASVVAPCHIVLAHLDQLVPDLETALAGLQESGVTSRNSSRTRAWWRSRRRSGARSSMG